MSMCILNSLLNRKGVCGCGGFGVGWCVSFGRLRALPYVATIYLISAC